MSFLFLYLASLLSTSCIVYLYVSFTKIKFNLNLKNKIIIFIGSLMITIFNYYKITFLSLVSYFLFFPLMFYNTMKPRKRMLFYIIIIWFYGSIIDLLSVLILLVFGDFLQIGDIHNHIYELIPMIFITFVYLKFGKNKWIEVKTKIVVDYLCNMVFLDFLLLFYVLFIFCIGVAIVLNIYNLEIVYLLGVILILGIFGIYLLIMFIAIRYENKIFIKNLKENNNYYLKQNEENRIFRHNINSKLVAIKSVTDKKAKDLIDDLIADINAKPLTNLEDIPFGFMGVIYQKINPYKNDILIFIKNSIEEEIFDILKARNYNVLIEKMSVLLDNAIEACKNSAEKKIEILIYENGNSVCVDIINTFNSVLDLDKLGDINYSTKGKQRGVGLFSILRKNEVTSNIEIVNNLFIARLTTKKIGK